MFNLFHMFGIAQANASLKITWQVMRKHHSDSSQSQGFVACLQHFSRKLSRHLVSIFARI